MDRADLIEYVLDSNIFRQWHWFTYHFTFYKHRHEHAFAKAIIDALLQIDHKLNGYATEMVDRIAMIAGKEKDVKHLEQLLQICSEIYVIKQAVTFWGSQAVMEHEPVSNMGKKLELLVQQQGYSLGLEVKQPSLLYTGHSEKREKNPLQMMVRHDFGRLAFQMPTTLPRDNPVKDFLISANEKFSGFSDRKDFYGILFIVWDDYIVEPISAILGNPSGLFCKGSFAKDSEGNCLLFPYVDAVIIDRQLHNIGRATADQPLIDGKMHAMDYGREGEFPFKVIIQNPVGKKVPAEIAKCFQAHPPDRRMGAEYGPMDIVFRM